MKSVKTSENPSGLEVEVDHRSHGIHGPVRTPARVVLMLKISFEFEVSRYGESRTGDQRRPAHFAKPAVVVDFTAAIRIEPEAANGEFLFDCQSVAVTPGELSLNRS